MPWTKTSKATYAGVFLTLGGIGLAVALGAHPDLIPESTRLYVGIAGLILFVVSLLAASFVLSRPTKEGRHSGSSLRVSGGAVGLQHVSIQNSPGTVIGAGREQDGKESTSIVRPSPHYRHSTHWEVLDDLPRESKAVLYSVLESGKKEIGYTREVSTLLETGLLEERLRTDDSRGVFRIPAHLIDLVKSFRGWEWRAEVQLALNNAEYRELGRQFLRLFTLQEIPKAVSSDLLHEGLAISTTLAMEHQEPEPKRHCFRLSDLATEELGDTVLGESLLRDQVEILGDQVDGYDEIAVQRILQSRRLDQYEYADGY